MRELIEQFREKYKTLHNFVTNKDKKNVFLLNCFGVIIIFIIVYKVFSKKKVIKK